MTQSNQNPQQSEGTTRRFQPGVYPGKAIEGAEQFGKTEKGGDQVVLELELVDGPHKGERFSTFLFFTDAAAPYALERLRTLGWEGGDTLKGIGKNVVNVQLAYELYDGKERLKVQILTGGRVELKEPMNETEKRGFMQRLNTLNKQSGGQQQMPGTQFEYGANQPGVKNPRVNLG